MKLCSDEQPWNAYSPIEPIALGSDIVTELSDEQLRNAFSGMEVILPFIVMLVRSTHERNAAIPRAVHASGSTIVVTFVL